MAVNTCLHLQITTADTLQFMLLRASLKPYPSSKSINMIENSTGQQIERLSIFQEKKESVQKITSGNGGEYTSCQCSKFCQDRGISHQFTNPYSPEQNGVPEHLNRTLIEAARSVLYHSNVPLKFWVEAVNTAVYLQNRRPTTALDDKTPYECCFKKKPIVSNLRVSGCICFVHTPDSLRKKLDPKASKAVFVGYPNETKGYEVYDLNSKHFIQSKNILFFEDKFHNFELNEESNKRELVYDETNEINDPTEIPVVEDQPIVQSQPVEPTVMNWWEKHTFV